MKKLIPLLLALAVCFSACGSFGAGHSEPALPEATAEPTPEPTPVPTPTPTPVPYEFEVYGQTFSTDCEEIDLNHIRIDDNGDELRKYLPECYRLKTVIMDSCRVDDEHMAKLREDYPDIEFVWRVFFGGEYSCRTNVEKILASCPGAAGDLTVENYQGLKYCTKVRYLDIGHNEELNDISAVAYMPDLEVAVLAMIYFTDLSPVENCTKLEFLEIQSNYITDLSPLRNLKNLKHLNICNNPDLADITPIMDLDLDRLWIGVLTQIPQEQIDEYIRRHPNCEVNTDAYDPHGGDWRYTGAGYSERYALLVEQFGYDRQDYTLSWRDRYFYEGNKYPWE